MCFSPDASFVASAGLAALGVPTYLMAGKKEKILSSIPFIFAIQQGIEGVQWLALRGGSVNMIAGYAFLFFALFVWPILIPFMVYRLDGSNRHILKLFIAFGTVVSFSFLWILVSSPLSIDAVNRCIVYHLGYPEYITNGLGMLYVFVVSGALLLSERRELQWLGVIAFFSAFIAAVFFLTAFISVWCFFAAVLSVLIFLYVYLKRKNILT